MTAITIFKAILAWVAKIIAALIFVNILQKIDNVVEAIKAKKTMKRYKVKVN